MITFTYNNFKFYNFGHCKCKINIGFNKNKSMYLEKYLKYKNKYLKLKKLIKQKN